MHNCLPLLGLVCLLSQVTHARGSDEPHAIQGEWRVVAQEFKGRDDSGVSFRGMRYTFTKDTYTLTPGATTPAGLAGRPPLTGPYAVDDSKSPQHLDYTMRAGKSRTDVRAIYKLVDGKLNLCFGPDDRPTSFDTDGTGNIRYIMERVAVDEPDRKSVEPDDARESPN